MLLNLGSVQVHKLTISTKVCFSPKSLPRRLVQCKLIMDERMYFQIGLVEQEWLDTLPTINPEQVTFIDFVEAGRKLALQLKEEVCLFIMVVFHTQKISLSKSTMLVFHIFNW